MKNIMRILLFRNKIKISRILFTKVVMMWLGGTSNYCCWRCCCYHSRSQLHLFIVHKEFRHIIVGPGSPNIFVLSCYWFVSKLILPHFLNKFWKLSFILICKKVNCSNMLHVSFFKWIVIGSWWKFIKISFDITLISFSLCIVTKWW